MTSFPYSDVYTMVTAKIIQALEAGSIPWKRPWRTSWPMNLATNREYQGINTLLLSLTQHESPYWLTFKQAARLGGSIRKGEKAPTFVVFAKEYIYRGEDQDGNEVVRKSFILKYSPIFNIEQTRGIEPPEEVKVESVNAETYLQAAACKPVIRFGGDKAFFNPLGDYIQLPPKGQFTSPQGYYSTLFHECGHWTGHSTRLNRDFTAVEATRVREELTAEMFAAFTLHKTGLDAEIKNTAAYIESWIQHLKNDKKALLVAAREARKAIAYFETGVLPAT